MRKLNNVRLILALGIIMSFVFLISFSSSQDFSILNEENVSLDIKARSCLKEINLTIQVLKEDNFSTERILDIFEQAEALYNSQMRKIQPSRDFSSVIEHCETVDSLYGLAYLSRDEFDAVVKFYHETISPDVDALEIDAFILEIQQELVSERYELVGGLVDEAYDKIIELKASQGTLEIIKMQTASFFIKLVTRNLEIKIPIIILLILFYVLFRKRILRAYLVHKINNLHIRRKTLKNLIKRMQRNYFQENRISEGSYNLKTQKFAELIRDLDRQVPLLEEELARLSKKSKNAFRGLKNEKTK